MQLARFRVQKFRNIVDSGEINVEDDVTCLVGMNEAGKTAVLAALNRLNPADGSQFNLQSDYPRWLLVADRRARTTDGTTPVEAVFKLDDADIAAVEEILGAGVLVAGDEVTVRRRYGASDNDWTLLVRDEVAVANAVEEADVAHDLAEGLRRAKDLPELLTTARDLLAEQEAAEVGDAGRQADLRKVVDEVTRLNGGTDSRKVVSVAASILRERLPKFFYFSDYSLLPGRIDLSGLNMDADVRAGSTPEQTVRSLLRLAETTPADLSGDDYENRVAEMEAVGADLTEQVFTYWKQNPNLRVRFDVDRVPTAPQPGQPPVVRPHLDVRVEDTRHHFTNNFDQRSSGFRWFFSFLAAFTEFEARDAEADHIVLLDEPGLTLHGKVQADFLFFINDRLAPVAQVLYTTHSPFMVETDKIKRVRIVEDGGPKTGATVSKEVLRAGADSLFPLQAALGYDVVQHLFIGQSNLLVEGPADFIFLDTVSRHLESQGLQHLDEDWRIMPAGGANNIPAFVALIGTTMEVSVLIDAGTEGAQRLQRAIEAGRLNQKRLIEISEITGSPNSDIEDVFEPDDYLVLYNAAFSQTVSLAALPPGDRIVKRIEQHAGAKYDHYKPAEALLRGQVALLPALSPATVARFGELFKRINDSRLP